MRRAGAFGVIEPSPRVCSVVVDGSERQESCLASRHSRGPQQPSIRSWFGTDTAYPEGRLRALRLHRRRPRPGPNSPFSPGLSVMARSGLWSSLLEALAR